MEAQAEKISEEDTQDDPRILLVTGNKNVKDRGLEAAGVKKLAHAVVETIDKHGQAKLKCVGAAAVNRAVKAVIVAELNEQEADSKVSYSCRPHFSTASFDGGKVEKTAIIFVVNKNVGVSGNLSSYS